MTYFQKLKKIYKYIKEVNILKVAIGQDSHRIDYNNTNKKLILGRNRI